MLIVETHAGRIDAVTVEFRVQKFPERSAPTLPDKCGAGSQFCKPDGNIGRRPPASFKNPPASESVTRLFGGNKIYKRLTDTRYFGI